MSVFFLAKVDQVGIIAFEIESYIILPPFHVNVHVYESPPAALLCFAPNLPHPVCLEK